MKTNIFNRVRLSKRSVLLVFPGAFALRSCPTGSTPTERIRLPDGFKIELLYSVPRDDQGSWVAMCQDDKGRLIVVINTVGSIVSPFPNLGKRLTLAHRADHLFHSRGQG